MAAVRPRENSTSDAEMEVEMQSPQRKDFDSSQSNDDESGKYDLLPPTGSRNAKWWYSTFHNVTAIVGAGVLGLPTAMARLGWGPGVVVLVCSWVITLFTMWQMVEMHEMPEMQGKRFDRYHELGQRAFGDKLGLWIVLPQQLIVMVGTNIVYMVTGGQSLWKFYRLVKCPKIKSYDFHTQCGHIGPTAFIIIFASQHFVLAQLPNFSAISGISLAAAIMSLSYSTIAWTDTLSHGQRRPQIHYNVISTTTPNLVFGVFKALGVVAFAYAGHNVVLEIQATLPSIPPDKLSKKAMWRGVKIAYIIVAMCYFPVALIGYWAYGNSLVTKVLKDPNDKILGSGNILVFLNNPKKLIAMANFMVVLHVTGSYQLYAMPVFDMLENALVRKLYHQPTKLLRLVTRCTYVFFTAFVACTIPFFEDLLGFVGGFAFTPTTYFLPCIIWLCVKKPRPFSPSWLANWFCIVIGTLLMLVATIGGFRFILTDAKSYQQKFYQ